MNMIKRFSIPTLLLALLAQFGCDRNKKNISAPAPSSSEAAQPTNSPTSTLIPLTNMVLIKAGTYLRIQFPVTLTDDFWIGKYEVTQGEFQRVMGKNPSHFSGETNRPVEKVAFADAQVYCAALTQQERAVGRLPGLWEYRLPTEGEWEYACRAGSTNLFSFGEDAALSDSYAWTMENAENVTHLVGQKHPNLWGLYDMHGNVWEWCSDWFEPYPAGHLTDPAGPAQTPQSKYKVFRGGGWNNDVNMARASNRFMMEPARGIHFVGFRVVLGQRRGQSW